MIIAAESFEAAKASQEFSAEILPQKRGGMNQRFYTHLSLLVG